MTASRYLARSGRLGAYLQSVWIGLFGFKEIRSTAGIAAGWWRWPRTGATRPGRHARSVGPAGSAGRRRQPVAALVSKLAFRARDA